MLIECLDLLTNYLCERGIRKEEQEKNICFTWQIWWSEKGNMPFFSLWSDFTEWFHVISI